MPRNQNQPTATAGKRLAVFANNTRAIGLYESLGFVEEGRLRRDVQLSDGSYGDTFLMAKFYEA